jgi:hypothetical protein
MATVAIKLFRLSAALAIFLLSCSAPGWCGARRGTYDVGCSDHLFLVPTSQKGATKRVLVLQVHNPLPLQSLKWRVSEEWFDVEAKRCVKGTESCEVAAKARIRLDAVDDSERRISGSFTVEFDNGDRDAEDFVVLYHHKGRKVECM